MSASFCLEIAGIAMAARCDAAAIALESDPAYEDFIGSVAGRAAPDVEVRIGLNGVPRTSGLKRIFDSGESWSLYADGCDLLLVLSPPTVGSSPVWAARFDRDAACMTIQCGETLLTNTDAGPTVSNPLRYPLDQLFLMHLLARRRGAIVHAAGAAIAGRTYLFPGCSGAGKSTLSRQLMHRPEVRILSDDRIVVRQTGEMLAAYGTPWPGEAQIAVNSGGPLAGIFFIEKGGGNRAERISSREALERLMPVTSIPWYDAGATTEMLDFCEQLVTTVPACLLHCTASPEAADVLVAAIADADA